MNHLSLYYRVIMLDLWNLSGAIGIEQIKKLDDLVYQRRQNAQTFIDLFSGFE